MSRLNLVGRTLGDFEVISELGRGAMGVVYKARQKSLKRIVAMKVLPPEFTYDENYVVRFRREAESAAQLEHPNIIPIYEVGEAEGLYYIIMRYIEGQTLREVMQQEGAMSIERVVTLLIPVASALDDAHEHQIVHRDIKPSNIMVARNATVYLADFGLARGIGGVSGMTSTGMIMGTPDYMSPEQARGLTNVGAPTDIYALGIVIYQMLTGALPFEAESTLGLLHARLIEPPKPPRTFRPDLPPSIEQIILQALAREPEHRYARAGLLLADLRDTLEQNKADSQATYIAFPRQSDPRTPANHGSHPPPTVVTPPGGTPIPPASPSAMSAPSSKAIPPTPTVLTPPKGTLIPIPPRLDAPAEMASTVGHPLSPGDSKAVGPEPLPSVGPKTKRQARKPRCIVALVGGVGLALVLILSVLALTRFAYQQYQVYQQEQQAQAIAAAEATKVAIAQMTATVEAANQQATAAADATATAIAETTAVAEATGVAITQMTATVKAVSRQATAEAGATATVVARAIATREAQPQAADAPLPTLPKSLRRVLEWPVVFADDFSTDAHWFTGEESDEYATANRYIENGVYHLDLQAHKDVISWATPFDIPLLEPFYTTVQVRQLHAPVDWGYGLVFRLHSDPTSYYTFETANDQEFRVRLSNDGTWEEFIGWTDSSAFQPGAWNRLAVIGEGAYFTFFINNQQVAKYDDDRLIDGKVGFEVSLPTDSEGSWEFDNFEIRVP